MKITKSAFEVLEQKRKRDRANRGCHSCPFCLESISVGEAISSGLGLKRGISSIAMSRSVRTGLFSSEDKTVELFRCNRCGAEWEGDPY